MKLKDLKCKKCLSLDLVGLNNEIFCKQCGELVKTANPAELKEINKWLNNEFTRIKNDGSVMQVEDGKWDGTTERRYKHIDILSRLDWIGTTLYEIQDILKQMKDKENDT